LDEPPCAVRALVRLVSAVDLAMSVERARVSQLLSADLAGHGGLAARVGRRQGVGMACENKHEKLVKKFKKVFTC
jgi:hypothetical protein